MCIIDTKDSEVAGVDKKNRRREDIGCVAEEEMYCNWQDLELYL